MMRQRRKAPRVATGSRWVRGSGGGRWVGEDVGQVQTREEAVDDGEGGHGLGIETEGTVALHGVDTSCCLLYITVNMGSVKGYS